MSSPSGEGRAGGDIAVTVTRTGGLAGLRAQWSAQAPIHEEERWVALIETCPWDAPTTPEPTSTRGADRFVWRIDARCGEHRREAQLPDQAVVGPWRDLIDEVRQASSSA